MLSVTSRRAPPPPRKFNNNLIARRMACTLRLLNELPLGGPAVSLSAGGAAVASAPPAGASAHVDAPCSGLSLDAGAGGAANVTLPAGGASRFTILVTARTPITLAVAVFSDAAALIPDGVDNIDAVALRVINARPAATRLSGVASECYNCELPALDGGTALAPGAAAALTLDSSYGYFLGFGAGEVATLPPLAEHGTYTAVLHAGGGAALLTDVPGRDAALPLLYLFLIAAGAALVHRIAVGVVAARAALAARAARRAGERAAPPLPARRAVTPWSVFGRDSAAAEAAAAAAAEEDAAADDDDAEADATRGGRYAPRAAAARLLGGVQTEGEGEGAGGAAPAAVAAAHKASAAGRVLSLDTFRGFALCIMMFVNAGGGKYSYLDHSKWNGLTVADLVFPWFVFMSGVAMALSLEGERRRGATAGQLVARAAVRAGKLFLLGLLVNNDVFLPNIRIPSVLFYFAVSYLIVGTVDALAPPDGVGATPAAPTTLAGALYLDIGRYALQWVALSAVAAVYLFVQFFLPVAGCPTGYLGPGGLADGGAHRGCTGGAHRAVDVAIFGERHIYAHPTCEGEGGVYDCSAHDPEGALGALSAAWMAWLGLQAGRALVLQRALAKARGDGGGAAAVARAVTTRWAVSALVLCAAAGALCGFKKEGGFIPVNKNLWSPSFVLLLAGFANASLAGLFWVVDVWRAWSGAPFRFVGANSLAVYLTSELLSDQVPFEFAFNDAKGWTSHSEALVSNTLTVLTLLTLARVWHLQKWSWAV